MEVDESTNLGHAVRRRMAAQADLQSVPSGRLVRETLVKRQAEPGRIDPIGPRDLVKLLPFGASAASDRLGWGGLEAARYPRAPASELSSFALTPHPLGL